MSPGKTALRLLKRSYKRIRKRWGAYRNRRADFGAYKRWLVQHPGGNFKQFYFVTIERHLAGEGGSHSTLGLHPIWEKQGDEILQQLIELGLQPHEFVVDYGCGTLREGIHLIRYLKAGRYVGLDTDDRILETGRRLIGPALLVEKQPFLAVTTPSVIKQAAATPPAWIISSYVISQTPPDDLDEYFDNLGKLMERGGRAVLQLRLAWRTRQYSTTGWYHNRRQVIRRLTTRNLEILQMRTRRVISKPYRVRGVDARLIVGTRHQPLHVGRSRLADM